MTSRPPTFPPRRPAQRPSVDEAPAALAVAERDEAALVDSGEDVPQVEIVDAPPVSSGLTDRIAERQRARRRLRLRALALVTAAVLAVAGLGWLALASPVLALRSDDVAVQGATEYVDDAAVTAAVQAHDGEPLLRIDTPALREQLLQVTGVRDVTIQRDFPHGLVVTVVPRVPVASVAQDGAFAVLDADGVVLATSDSQPDDIPLVRVPVGTEDTDDSLAAVLDVMAALPEEIRDTVTDASARTPYEVQFELESGARVVWGTTDDSALKAEVLAALLPVPATVYDVSAPLSPITR